MYLDQSPENVLNPFFINTSMGGRKEGVPCLLDSKGTKVWKHTHCMVCVVVVVVVILMKTSKRLLCVCVVLSHFAI